MKIKTQVQTRLASFDRIVMWGAGGLGQNAWSQWLPQRRIEVVVDTFVSPGSTFLGNLVVKAPDDVDWTQVDSVVICVSAHTEVRKQLSDLGFNGISFYIYELFLPIGGVFSEFDKLRADIAATKHLPWVPFLFEKPQILVNISFRVASYFAQHSKWNPLYWISYAVHHTLCALLHIQLPLGTSVGPGLVFAHFGTIVFTKRATIGSFFTIYHCCTVGTNDSGQGPTIGDFVTQYAGSHILGRTHLQDGCRVGANAVVLDTLANAESTLVGIPARVIEKGP